MVGIGISYVMVHSRWIKVACRTRVAVGHSRQTSGELCGDRERYLDQNNGKVVQVICVVNRVICGPVSAGLIPHLLESGEWRWNLIAIRGYPP